MEYFIFCWLSIQNSLQGILQVHDLWYLCWQRYLMFVVSELIEEFWKRCRIGQDKKETATQGRLWYRPYVQCTANIVQWRTEEKGWDHPPSKIKQICTHSHWEQSKHSTNWEKRYCLGSHITEDWKRNGTVCTFSTIGLWSLAQILKTLMFTWAKLRSEGLFERAGIAWTISDEFVFEVKGGTFFFSLSC